ncbi:Bax inhibitor-1/YccA family protein [Candidatus Peregrinibacteria bacterium]|nr:Bax inhibitor-1/YccA family protein [Candidatus Peregrinibacteria bacterium]
MYNQEVAQTRPVYGSSFVSKVMFFFGLAVAASAAGAFVGLNYLIPFFLSNTAFIYLLIIAELGLILTSQWWSKTTPLNYILFTIFAVITGITLVPVLAYFLESAAGVDILIKAFGATALMFGAAAVFGHTTHFNLQGLRGFLMMSLIGMIVVSVIGIFVPWSNTFEMIFSGIGVVLFSAYTMYDMQKLKSYPEDMYILAAMSLYLDIFNLFLYILRLLAALNRR